MRGGESITTKAPLSIDRPPLSAPHPPPPNGGSQTMTRQGLDSQVDVASISGQAWSKHVRASASKSDAYISYKRVSTSDVALKGSDVISKPTKTKVAKSKSDGVVSDLTTAKYTALSPHGKVARRSKQAKKDRNSEKLSVSKLPNRTDDRPSLGRRSRTFVIESHHRLTDDMSPHSSPPKKLESTDASQGSLVPPYNISASSSPPKERRTESDKSGRKDVPGHQSLSRGSKSQWGDGMERDQGRMDQWETGREGLRDGARNPVDNCWLPIRPKSAGQIRYCDSEDSDESSLDGEIEIVDIDKELAEDPEPSPYWSQSQPLQVPEVFVQTSPTSGSSSSRSGETQNGRQSLHTDFHHHHHHYHHQQQHQHLSSLPPQYPLLSRQRRGSGESDFSTFSDTVVKTAMLVPQSHPRRRFMSEPEILHVERERQPPMRSDGKGKKPRPFHDPGPTREGSDVTDAPPSSVLPRGRERLYSDTMERVLSRYSEMGLRETHDDVSVKGRASKIPVGYHVSGSSARDSVIPPRKLKPILKQRKADSSSLFQS